MASKTDTNLPAAGNSSGSVAVSKSQQVLTHTSAPGGAATNRKKQKRRQKQAARQATSHDHLSPTDFLDNPQLSNGNLSDFHHSADLASTQPFPQDPSLASSLEYLDPPHLNMQHNNQIAASTSQANKKKKKLKASATQDSSLPPEIDPTLSNGTASLTQPARPGSLWDTDGLEERSRIKDFWLNLTENERRDLVNIEKSHVLQKMKEQQKHSCSCTVCGRKRTAIEEELESLLKDPRIWADPTTNPPSDRLPSSLSASSAPSRRRVHEFVDDQDDEYPEDDPVEYSDEYDDDDEEDDDDFSDDLPSHVASDFFHFGNSLTVKDGILTVADDLLKNDGQKFIDMMEQLAERRMQREEDARYGSAHSYPSHGSMSPPHGSANHLGEPPLEDDEYDDEEEDDYDDDGDLDYDDEDDEEMDALTEDQRMEEGRRMFQIFAARMFEQRVVTAYREKVAFERQQALINEQEQDTVGASDAKKSKNAEKKKRQRQAAKEAKALKEAAKEEEKLRKEAAVRATEDKKKEEQRLKQEEAKRKKEAERKAQDEKRRKKEAEAQKRLEADRERQMEQERKNREHKAEEKKKREEAEKKKRDEKEAREREAKEKRTQDEAEKNESGDNLKELQQSKSIEAAPVASVAEPSTSEPSFTDRPAATEQTRRPAIPMTATSAVAVPPNLKSRNSQTSHESPSAKIATPALPKAPTPARARETPTQQASIPHTPERTPQSKQSTPPKTGVSHSIHPPGIPPSRQYPFPSTNPAQSSSVHPVASHPSVPFQQPAAPPPTGSTSPFGINGYPNIPGAVPRMPQTQQSSGFGAPQSMAAPPRPGIQNAPHNTAPLGQTSRSAFPEFTPSNFNQQLPAGMSTSVQPPYPASQRDLPVSSVVQHSRQLSNQFEGLSLDTQSNIHSAATQPIGRPAPIKRPSSVNKVENRNQDRSKSFSKNTDMDDLSNHLGSSALLDDTDEPLPSSISENRRPSAAPGGLRSSSSAVGSPLDYMAAPFGPSSRAPGDSWSRTSAAPYGAPGMLPPAHNQASTSMWSNIDMNSPPLSGSTSAGGWGSSSSHTNTFGITSHHRSAGGNPRAITVRMFTVQACKSLSSQSSGVENSGFFDFSDVVRHTVESGRQMHVEPGIQLSEIRNILDTEGDSNNGGGTFLVRQMDSKGSMNSRTLVRWVSDHTPMESYSRQLSFYHQQPGPHQSPHTSSLQGPFGGSTTGPASSAGQRQGFGLGEIGSPVSDARLPNLGGLGRF